MTSRLDIHRLAPKDINLSLSYNINKSSTLVLSNIREFLLQSSLFFLF